MVKKKTNTNVTTCTASDKWCKKNAFRCQITTNRLLEYHFLLKKNSKWKLKNAL